MRCIRSNWSVMGTDNTMGTVWWSRWHGDRVIVVVARQTAGQLIRFSCDWSNKWVRTNKSGVYDQSHTNRLCECGLLRSTVQWWKDSISPNCLCSHLLLAHPQSPHLFSVSASVTETDCLQASGSKSVVSFPHPTPAKPRGSLSKKWPLDMCYDMLICLEGTLWLTVRAADLPTNYAARIKQGIE